MDQCQTCFFLHAVRDAKEIGKVNYFCRRNPPAPLAIVQPIPAPPPSPFAPPMPAPPGVHVQIVAAHAPVQLDGGCGEHKPIDAPANRSPLLTS